MGRYNQPKQLEIGQKVSYGIGATIGTVVKRVGTDYQVEFEDGRRIWAGKNILQPEISEEEIAAARLAIQATWSEKERQDRIAGAYQSKGYEVARVTESQISVSRTSRVF